MSMYYAVIWTGKYGYRVQILNYALIFKLYSPTRLQVQLRG